MSRPTAGLPLVTMSMINGGTVTLRSSRDSRGRNFEGVPIQDKEKAVEVLDALYEESIDVVRYRGALMRGAHVASRFNTTVLDWLLEHDVDFAVLTHPKKQNCAHIACNSFCLIFLT